MAERITGADLSSARLACVTGVLGALWLLAMIVIGGAAYPGYDHGAQFISELGAIDAPHGVEISRYGFLPIGVLACAFSFFAWRATPRTSLGTLGFIGIFLFSVGYVGSGFFQCDARCRPNEPSFSQVMHTTIGLAGYMLAPFTLLLLGFAARKWPGGGSLSLLAFVGVPIAFVALGFLTPDFAYVGVAQRFLEASVMLWVVACALYLGRRKH
jgi:hypothetical membrane protein